MDKEEAQEHDGGNDVGELEELVVFASEDRQTRPTKPCKQDEKSSAATKTIKYVESSCTDVTYLQ